MKRTGWKNSQRIAIKEQFLTVTSYHSSSSSSLQLLCTCPNKERGGSLHWGCAAAAAIYWAHDGSRSCAVVGTAGTLGLEAIAVLLTSYFCGGFKEKSQHSLVYYHIMGVKCPSRYMTSGAFYLGCYYTCIFIAMLIPTFPVQRCN